MSKPIHIFNTEHPKVSPLDGYASSEKKNSDVTFASLPNDAILFIMEYIPSLMALHNFAATSKRSYIILSDKIHEDRLHRGVYEHMYCNHRRTRMDEANTSSSGAETKCAKDAWSWKKEMKRQHMLSVFFKNQELNNGKTEEQKRLAFLEERRKRGKHRLKRRERVGILPSEEEDESIIYDDNTIPEDPGGASLGYFGMEALDINSSSPQIHAEVAEEQSPVVIWGDFHGVRIFPSLDSLLWQKEQNEGVLNVETVGDERSSEVLVVLPCHFHRRGCSCCRTTAGIESPCLFLGFADGNVMAVTASLGIHSRYKYSTNTSRNMSNFHHGDEVTALSFVHSKKSRPLLISGSVDGTVLIYPHAVCCAELENPILALRNLRLIPILSVAYSCDGVLFTGDQRGDVNVWQPQTVNNSLSRNECMEQDYKWLPSNNNSNHIIHLSLSPGLFQLHSTHRGTSKKSNNTTRRIIVTQLIFAMNTYLISTNNNGELRIWELVISNTTEKKLKLCHKIQASDGTVESLRMSGNLLLTSGSNSCIKAWDIEKGRLIGKICCNFTSLNRRRNHCSSVIGFAMTKTSIISILRNGSIGEWEFFNFALKSLQVETIRNAGSKMWPCPRCTLHNPMTSRKCKVCKYDSKFHPSSKLETSNPVLKGVSTNDKLVEERRVIKKTYREGNESLCLVPKKNPVSVLLEEVSNPCHPTKVARFSPEEDNHDEWSCFRCTFLNRSDTRKCNGCQSLTRTYSLQKMLRQKTILSREKKKEETSTSFKDADSVPLKSNITKPKKPVKIQFQSGGTPIAKKKTSSPSSVLIKNTKKLSTCMTITKKPILNEDWTCLRCTFQNNAEHKRCRACFAFQKKQWLYLDKKQSLVIENDGSNSSNEILSSLSSSVSCSSRKEKNKMRNDKHCSDSILIKNTKKSSRGMKSAEAQVMNEDWFCFRCTFENNATYSRCHICSANRNTKARRAYLKNTEASHLDKKESPVSDSDRSKSSNEKVSSLLTSSSEKDKNEIQNDKHCPNTVLIKNTKPPSEVMKSAQTKKLNEGWFCSRCTFQNNTGLNRCQLCSAYRNTKKRKACLINIEASHLENIQSLVSDSVCSNSSNGKLPLLSSSVSYCSKKEKYKMQDNVCVHNVTRRTSHHPSNLISIRIQIKPIKINRKSSKLEAILDKSEWLRLKCNVPERKLPLTHILFERLAPEIKCDSGKGVVTKPSSLTNITEAKKHNVDNLNKPQIYHVLMDGYRITNPKFPKEKTPDDIVVTEQKLPQFMKKLESSIGSWCCMKCSFYNGMLSDICESCRSGIRSKSQSCQSRNNDGGDYPLSDKKAGVIAQMSTPAKLCTDEVSIPGMGSRSAVQNLSSLDDIVTTIKCEKDQLVGVDNNNYLTSTGDCKITSAALKNPDATIGGTPKTTKDATI